MPETADCIQQPSRDEESASQQADPIFQQEQRHLTDTFDTLTRMQRAILAKMEKTRQDAAATKKSMSDDLTANLATYDDAMEMYAEIESLNRIVDGYNLSQSADAEKLASIRTLLAQPYFAKVVLQFKPGEAPKELYIGNAGISDDSCKRLVVDWRSPVAETYYNQDTGPTSYVANGRTINVDLKLRRQFDIVGSTLNAYFDTTVAIQDALLLASLSQRRTSQMKAITATIQKEQNQVIRHDDVPALLVQGIAGSGKTSVLMQRIAYLFYQNRETLRPQDVYLITPNPMFKRYIENVLPDLGESNPETLTWTEFAQRLMPANHSLGGQGVSCEALRRIDDAMSGFEFDDNDFKDLVCEGFRLISAGQIRQLSTKFRRIPAGPHRVTLMREELTKRLASRLKQMAATERVHNELAALSIEEQVRIFHETIDPQTEEEARALSLSYLNDKYAGAFAMVERDDWVRIDRIGMRILGSKGLSPVEWLYLKMAVTGLSNPSARYVMVDEVQDYSAAQLMVLKRYFRRAHFLLLGDKNQAIKEHTASFEDIRSVFEGPEPVAECSLMTSYRSTPEITALFARLLPESERVRISSVQREESAPVFFECGSDECYADALRRAIARTAGADGLTAVIVPDGKDASRLRAVLGEAMPPVLHSDDAMPDEGVVVIALPLAKGLEFDHVIIPDASDAVFPDERIARNRLYTTISRATRTVTVLSRGAMARALR